MLERLKGKDSNAGAVVMRQTSFEDSRLESDKRKYAQDDKDRL